MDYRNTKEFLDWLDREIPKEKDPKLKEAMQKIKKKIMDKLKEKEDKKE